MTHQAELALAPTLDYEALVADYEKGLVDRLRGFGAAAECLSLWVPDEDPATSLRNLWDAAAAAGERDVTVYIGQATAAKLDSDDVLATAARFGVATLTFGRTGWLVEVQELRAALPATVRRTVAARTKPTQVASSSAADRESDDVPAIHAAAIARAAEQRRHEGELAPEAGRVLVRVEVEATTLTLLVDPANHVITRAAFANAPHPGVLETFCALVETVPILDAADHGTLRVELALRDEPSHRTVQGIVSARSLAPCFRLPLALGRAALAEYRRLTGFSERVSTHDPGPGASWRAMTPAQRTARVSAVVNALAEKRGGKAGAIELVAIEMDIRLVLRIDDALLSRCGARLVLDAEQTLRHSIDPRLEVVLEEIRDRNRKRRLAVVE